MIAKKSGISEFFLPFKQRFIHSGNQLNIAESPICIITTLYERSV